MIKNDAAAGTPGEKPKRARRAKPKVKTLAQIMREARQNEAPDTLVAQLKIYGLPEPEREFEFHARRKWRFDFAWPALHLAVEIEGGLYLRGGGRHNRGGGYEKDLEKYNAATFDGWRVYRFSTGQVKRGIAINLITKVIRKEGRIPV